MVEGHSPGKNHDPSDREVYCGRLGHLVPFGYCIKPGDETPCPRILDCWWQVFDVVAYLRDRLSKDDFESVNSGGKAPNKLETIVEILSRIREDKSGR